MSALKFFAASNTEAGFVSYFAENFRRRADRCYIIKGGPGTGKSRLMREMGEAWENAGLNGACFDEIIEAENASLEGRIGYFKLNSQHFMSRHGWRRFMEFIELHKNEKI